METKIDTSSETKIISTAQQAVSQCNWVVGECAFEWTKRYAKGRTDADFALQVGLSPDQVFQRRRVWETFGDVFKDYSSLKWSHFYVSVNWDDASECLQWGEENGGTVAEMKAWRRAQRGEDLKEEDDPQDEWGNDPTITFVSDQQVQVRDPDGAYGEGEGGMRNPSEPVETMSAAARDSEAGYAPFRSGAGAPAPQEGGVAVADRPQPNAEQLLKKMTGSITRLNKSLDSSILNEMKKLSGEQREAFKKAVAELSAKVAGL
ncbi:hypothetical protein MNBD_PLANCTO02-1098 [hydrothermal vent metagenome]|uniref:Uncharacterized protein n=1 Tax=hydrothermal vent metagenome TaxID=652676 RepID=A0A3B1E6Q5_9ZZZZ